MMLNQMSHHHPFLRLQCPLQHLHVQVVLNATSVTANPVHVPRQMVCWYSLMCNHLDVRRKRTCRLHLPLLQFQRQVQVLSRIAIRPQPQRPQRHRKRLPRPHPPPLHRNHCRHTRVLRLAAPVRPCVHHARLVLIHELENAPSAGSVGTGTMMSPKMMMTTAMLWMDPMIGTTRMSGVSVMVCRVMVVRMEDVGSHSTVHPSVGMAGEGCLLSLLPLWIAELAGVMFPQLPQLQVLFRLQVVMDGAALLGTDGAALCKVHSFLSEKTYVFV